MTPATLKQRFSPARTALLIRNRALEDAPGLGIGLGTALGLNALTLVLSKSAFMNGGGGGTWTLLVVGAGLLLSAFAFKGMHDGKAGTEWILLPATPLEKYAAALVSYLLIYPLAASLLATGSSALLALVQGLVGGRSGTIWTPALAGGLELYAQYAIAAVVFLAGSASFRKRAVLKTAGLAVAYVFSLSVIVFLLLWAFFGESRGAAGGLSEGFRLAFDAKDLGEGGERALKAICDAMYFGVLPLFALLYGYFRVFEKEARDEVQ